LVRRYPEVLEINRLGTPRKQTKLRLLVKPRKFVVKNADAVNVQYDPARMKRSEDLVGHAQLDLGN
jgi:hypothetical protein